MRWLVGSLLGVLLCSAGLASAEGITVGSTCPVTWIASPSLNLKEYHILVSRTQGVYDKTKPAVIVSVPTTQSTCQALNLTVDAQYYLVVTAVGLNGSESGYSNEVAFVRDTSVPAPPSGVSVGP